MTLIFIFFRAGLLAILALAVLQGCSLDLPSPTAWLGSDDATRGEDGKFPNLSDVPDRPKELTTRSESRKSAKGLAADAQNAKHTAENLRGDAFAPAFALQPESSLSGVDTAPAPQTDEPDSPELESDQSSALPALNESMAPTPVPLAQPVVPVRVEEAPMPEPAAQKSDAVDRDTSAAPPSDLDETQPTLAENPPSEPKGVQSARRQSARNTRPQTLSASIYQSRLAASSDAQSESKRGSAGFVKTRSSGADSVVVDLPTGDGHGLVDLLLDDVASHPRNAIFGERLVDSAVIAEPEGWRLAAFAAPTGPTSFESESGTALALAESRNFNVVSQPSRSPRLDQRGSRRYTATLLEERDQISARVSQNSATDSDASRGSSSAKSVVLARTNASGFMIFAAEMLGNSEVTTGSVSVASAGVDAGLGGEGLPPFKTMTFARASAPDLSDVIFESRNAVAPPAPAAAQQLADVEQAIADPVPPAEQASKVKLMETMRETPQPPNVTLFFDEGNVRIEDSDEPDLERIADVQRERGGAVRVVTHVPSSTRNADQGNQLSLQESLDGARAVSKRMMKLGVHPTAVVVETRFDEQETLERMVQNTAFNLRVEVILE